MNSQPSATRTILELLVILVLALLVAGLLRSHADILKALHELGVDMEHDHDHDEPSFKVREDIVAPGDSVGTPAHDIGAYEAIDYSAHVYLPTVVRGGLLGQMTCDFGQVRCGVKTTLSQEEIQHVKE